VIDFTITLLNSTVGLLVGTAGLDAPVAFLKIIMFILIAIIVVGAIDSVHIFGDAPSAKWTNLIIGIIVSVIGVRFLPSDLMLSLTAPSSALVFALMIGLPLVALTFIIVNIKVEYVRKVIVLAYIIGLFTLFFQLDDSLYRTMAMIFLALGVLLLLFDGQVVKYLRQEGEKRKLLHAVGDVQLQERLKVRARIKELQRMKKHAEGAELVQLETQITTQKSLLMTFTDD